MRPNTYKIQRRRNYSSRMDYENIANVVKEAQGKWIKIKEANDASLVTKIRQGRAEFLDPLLFEAKSESSIVPVAGSTKRIHSIFVRLKDGATAIEEERRERNRARKYTSASTRHAERTKPLEAKLNSLKVDLDMLAAEPNLTATPSSLALDILVPDYNEWEDLLHRFPPVDPRDILGVRYIRVWSYVSPESEEGDQAEALRLEDSPKVQVVDVRSFLGLAVDHEAKTLTPITVPLSDLDLVDAIIHAGADLKPSEQMSLNFSVII